MSKNRWTVIAACIAGVAFDCNRNHLLRGAREVAARMAARP